MKKLICILLVTAVAAGLAWAAKRPSAAPQDDLTPGMLIIKIKPELRGSFRPIAVGDARSSFGVASLDGLCARYNVSRIKPLFYDPRISEKEKAVKHGLDMMYVLYLPMTTDLGNALRDFLADQAVEAGMPNVIKRTSATPNDPRFAQQWHLAKVQAALAWDIQQGDSTAVISIVDSGCDWEHQDLNANMWTNQAEDINGNGQFDNYSAGSGGDLDGIDNDGNGLVDDVVGWDFTDGDNNPSPGADPADHGTHCYGIANAVTNNGLGVAGLGWNCRHPGFRCTAGGSGIDVYAAFNAIYYSVDARASVISMSWGGYGYWVLERQVLEYAHDHGVVLVAAAGNDDIMDAHYPSGFTKVMAVAATNQQDQKSGSSGANSNYGTWIDVSSPGDAIWSTIAGNGYEAWYGTSMATPLVAGLVGLVRSQNPGWSNTTIETHIKKTCANIDAQNPAYVGLLGAGRIDAYNAMNTPARPELVYQDYTVSDPAKGNGNGKVDAGETAQLTVYVKNAWGDAYNVQGTLISGDPFVTVDAANSYYGSLEHAILGGHTRGNNIPYQITVSSNAPNHVARMNLHLTANGYDTTVALSMPIGRSGLLLVNHDDRSRLIWPFYRDAFSALGIDYDYWDWAEWKTPPLEKMRKFGTVFAYTEWSFPSLDSTDIDTLKAYLSQGGSFYIGGQDIGWDITESAAVPDCYDPDFYLNWMKAAWGGDDAGASSVNGASGDPIGDGLSFGWDQPYLTPDYEYPDYFDAAGGAVDFLQYNTGQYCGLRYAGPYRLVYTGFSPEAVVGDANRQELISRILRWLAGDVRIAHTPLPDNEDSLAANTVEAVITAENPLNTARSAVYWMKKSEGVYHLVPFTASGDTFRADIPAPGNPDSIFYFIYAEDNGGYASILPAGAPYDGYNFYAGPDITLPVVSLDQAKDTMDLIGPYQVSATVTDNIGVDTAGVSLHFWRNDLPQDSVPMTYLGGGMYSGTMSFGSWGQLHQRVHYFVKARDLASNPNTATSATLNLLLSDSAWVDKFTDSLALPASWDTGYGWCGTSGGSNPTAPGVKSQRGVRYPPNFSNIMTHKICYDFRPFTGMEMHFGHRRYLSAGDTGYVDVSRDGVDWTNIGKYAGAVAWVTETASIPTEYCGTGQDNDSIRIRFRFASDAAPDTNFGWFLDNIRYKATGPYGITGGPQEEALPKAVALLPAYPNPSRDRATISFQLPGRQTVRLEIYNIMGQRIRTLASGRMEPGYHKVSWDGRDESGRRVSNGIYFYKLEAGGHRLTDRLVVVR